MVAKRIITEEEWNDTAESAEERLIDRLAEPRRVSIFYDYLVADGKKALQEIAVEIGELKSLRETFRGDPKIVEWCQYFTAVALRRQGGIANDISKDAAKANDYRRIEDLFRRRQGDLIRRNAHEAPGPARGPGEREVVHPDLGPGNGGISGRGADSHFRPDQKREDAPGADARGQHGETAGVPPLFHF